MAKTHKAPVSVRAVLQRINRKLAPDYETVKIARPNTRLEQDCGRYYRVDIYRNRVIDGHIDPEALGRDLGVLAEWEKVEAEAA